MVTLYSKQLDNLGQSTKFRKAVGIVKVFPFQGKYISTIPLLWGAVFVTVSAVIRGYHLKLRVHFAEWCVFFRR